MARIRRYAQRAKDHEIVFRACVLALAVAIAALLYIVYNGAFGKLWLVTWVNTPVWIILAMVAGWGAFWTFTHEEMNWIEFVIYIAFCIPMSIPFIMIGYWYSTGLHAVERINGYFHGAEYQEEYTTESTYIDSDGKEQTSETWHPPEWHLLSSVSLYGSRQRVSCSEFTYRKYVNKFGNEQFHPQTHIDQVSIGDGNKYTTTWDGSEATKTPMVTDHPYVNYLKASERMEQMHASISGYEEWLKEYPEIHNGPNGPIELDRVITAGTHVPDSWIRNVDKRLDEALMTLGSSHQCNILVYIVGTGDRQFRYALEGYWSGNNKNDIVVIVGSQHYPTIDFVEVSCLSQDKLFEIELRDRLEAMGSLSGSPEEFASSITTQIRKPYGSGGYKREPMENYQYLIYEIDLPLWATFLLIVFTIGMTSPFMIFFLTNEFSDEDSSP